MPIRIVRRPTGQSPEWVRDAWIGLTLPTWHSAPREWQVVPLDQVPARFGWRFAKILRGRAKRSLGYAVPALRAVEILAVGRPDAADWLQSNAGKLLTNRSAMVFDADCAEPVRGPTTALLRLFPASPGKIACLWAAIALVGIGSAVCFPGEEHRTALESLFLSGMSIFGALVAASVLRMRASALHLVSALASLDLAVSLIQFLLKLALPPSHDPSVDGFVSLTYLIGLALLIQIGFGELRSKWRRLAATAAVAFVVIGASQLIGLNYRFWLLSEQVRPLIGRADPKKQDEQAPSIDADLLWGAQAGLVDRQVAAVRPAIQGTTNVYAMAIAGAGTQALFGREAHAALAAASAHFGSASRGGVLLSNAAADQMRSPLATRDTIAAAAKGLAARADPDRDILFVYLASHGSRDAELSSELSDYTSVQPISSVSLAAALAQAGIKRRIIVVSACFAASWIPALATDDTIVITAAAKDRTSFGCDDTRRLTIFGEDFLGSLAASSASLHDVFEQAKRKIAADERQSKATPSLPQVFVGHRMLATWLGSHLQGRARTVLPANEPQDAHGLTGARGATGSAIDPTRLDTLKFNDDAT